MTSPVIDAGNGGGSYGSGSFSSTSAGSFATTWGTSSTGAGVVVAVVQYGETSGTPAVSSISVSGLTFTKRSGVINTTSSAHRSTTEVWTAPFTSGFNHGGSSLTWTFNFSSNVDDATVGLFAVTGVYSTSSPFDNGSVPDSAFNTTSTTPPAATYSTSQADDLLIYISGRTNGISGTSTPSGWTLLGSKANNGGTNYAYQNVYYKSVSATQSGQTVADASTTNDVSWTSYVDAFTADNNNLNVSASVSMAMTKASFAVSETSHEEGGTASLALRGVAFTAQAAEETSEAVSFALHKTAFAIVAGTFQGATDVLGAAVLRVVRGVRDTIAGGSILGRVPGASGGAQQIPITMVADEVAKIMAGSMTSSPTTKSVGAAALQKQSLNIANAAVATRILAPSTVSGLPTGSDGLRGYVTDSTQTLTSGIGTAVVGGGSNHVPVYYDGGNSAWYIG